MRTPEQELKACCEEIRKEIQHWKDINQNGCNDPFWSDGAISENATFGWFLKYVIRSVHKTA